MSQDQIKRGAFLFEEVWLQRMEIDCNSNPLSENSFFGFVFFRTIAVHNSLLSLRPPTIHAWQCINKLNHSRNKHRNFLQHFKQLDRIFNESSAKFIAESAKWRRQVLKGEKSNN